MSHATTHAGRKSLGISAFKCEVLWEIGKFWEKFFGKLVCLGRGETDNPRNKNSIFKLLGIND